MKLHLEKFILKVAKLTFRNVKLANNLYKLANNFSDPNLKKKKNPAFIVESLPQRNPNYLPA